MMVSESTGRKDEWVWLALGMEEILAGIRN